LGRTVYIQLCSVSNYTNVRRCAFKGRRECAAVSIVEHRSRTGSPYRKKSTCSAIIALPHMESSSDVCRFRACTPHLQRVCDEFGTYLNDGSCKIAEAIGPFSVHDTYNMQPNMFISVTGGAQVIDFAKHVVNAKASLPSKPGSVHGGENVFAEVVIESLFKPKVSKLKHYELGKLPASTDSGGTSGQQDARRDIDSLVTDLMSLMDDSVRERFLAKYSTLPADIQPVVLRRAVRSDRSADHFRSVRDALLRFKRWSVSKFGVFRGFKADEAHVAWFFLDNLVADELDGHVSKTLYSGLKAAADTYKFPFSFSAPLASMCKAPAHMPKQAPSASVACVYHFWVVASNKSYSMPLRGVSAVFLVMCLAALRGIDAQRSVFDAEFRSPSGYDFFTAVAWDSKGKSSMPWACPIKIFDATTDWYDALRFVWGDRDYLFASVVRGVSLSGSPRMAAGRASAYLILRFLREIVMLPPLSMSAADAARLRRHSFRHFLANCIRLLKFSLPDAFQGGRWKDHHIMPLRYALEAKFIVMVDIIVRVVQACQEALRRVPFSQWPAFGGWEHLLPQREWGSVDVSAVAFDVEPEVGEVDDDSDDETEVDHVDERDAESLVPSSASSDQLPDGWTRVNQTLSSGRVVPHFYGPGGQYSRSLVGARRQAAAETPGGLVVCAAPDGASTVSAVPSSAPAAAFVVGAGPSASVAGSAPAVAAPTALGGASVPLSAPSSGQPSGKRKSSNHFYVEEVSPSKCGNPGCIVRCGANHVHGGSCVFPPPPSRRRRGPSSGSL
jgi:hypothetical protein